jgi:hypothetical protein
MTSSHNAHEKPLEALALAAAAPDAVVVESGTPAPIGARVSVDLGPLGLFSPEEAPLHGKVIDVRRAGDRFRVSLRLSSVSKSQREALKGWKPAPGDEP